MPLMNEIQLSEYLGLNVKTLQAWRYLKKGPRYHKLGSAVRYAESHIASAPTVRMLAGVASMSLYRLDRRMQRVFGLTTGQWLLKLRLDAAREQLVESDSSVATVAPSVVRQADGSTRIHRR